MDSLQTVKSYTLEEIKSFESRLEQVVNNAPSYGLDEDETDALEASRGVFNMLIRQLEHQVIIF